MITEREKTSMTKGYWIGDYDLGGVLVAAPDVHIARRIGEEELGQYEMEQEYLDVSAVRIPSLDGQPAGIVSWKHAVSLGIAIGCSHCGAYWIAREETWCPFCGNRLTDQQQQKESSQ